MANETVFTRYKGNPIITPKHFPGSNSIFNSAALKYKDGYTGIFRVENQETQSGLYVGWSKNGIDWKIDKRLIQFHDEKNGKKVDAWGYDPRVTEIAGTYYITWCCYPAGPGPAIALGKTKDFKTFTLVSQIMLPYNRNAALFPRKINGKYATLHRPSDTGHTPFGDIYYATSPDLVNWGEHHLVFGPGHSGWQTTKVGCGPVPIETKEGWLMIYHGVRNTCAGFIYCAGGALLDLDKPWKVMYRTKRYLLAPTEPYELMGDIGNVVFPNSIIVDRKSGDVAMYYGAADTVVGLAHAKLDDIIDFVKKNS